MWPLGGSATQCVILFAAASFNVGDGINYKGFIAVSASLLRLCVL